MTEEQTEVTLAVDYDGAIKAVVDGSTKLIEQAVIDNHGSIDKERLCETLGEMLAGLIDDMLSSRTLSPEHLLGMSAITMAVLAISIGSENDEEPVDDLLRN